MFIIIIAHCVNSLNATLRTSVFIIIEIGWICMIKMLIIPAVKLSMQILRRFDTFSSWLHKYVLARAACTLNCTLNCATLQERRVNNYDNVTDITKDITTIQWRVTRFLTYVIFNITFCWRNQCVFLKTSRARLGFVSATNQQSARRGCFLASQVDIFIVTHNHTRGRCIPRDNGIPRAFAFAVVALAVS